MDSFDQRKESILSKDDKASKGSWDERAIELCNRLNESDNYYTTSSCSGKAAIMEEKTGKDGSYYLWTSHDLITLTELREGLNLISSPPNSHSVKVSLNREKNCALLKLSEDAHRPIQPGNTQLEGSVSQGASCVVKFKSESPIFFVCCRDVDSAKDLLEKAVNSGFKESGIKITNKLIAVEVRSGEKIEFPIAKDGEVLVWDEFLRILVDEVSRKREFGWEKIEKLLSSLS